MTHLPVLPILIPLIAGALLVLLYDLPLWLQRVVSIASTLSLLGLALALGSMIGEAGHLVYALGSWAPLRHCARPRSAERSDADTDRSARALCGHLRQP